MYETRESVHRTDTTYYYKTLVPRHNLSSGRASPFVVRDTSSLLLLLGTKT